MATALLARPLAAVGGAAGRYRRPRVPLSGRARVVGRRPDAADARRSAGRSPPRNAAAAAAAASTAIALGPAAASSRPPTPPLPSPPPPPPPHTPPPGAETHDQNLLPPQAAASSVGESAPSTTPQPNGAEVPTASAHSSVVGTQPPSLSGSDTGIPSDRDCVEPRPPVDVESRTRKQKSPKRHKKRRLSAEEQDRDVKPAEDIDFVDSSTIATDSSGIIHQKVHEDKEYSPKSGGPENEAHCVDSQNVGSCESDQSPMTSQSSLGDWADDMEADDAQQTSISPPEPMADIEPGGLCQSGTHTAQ
ncbi:arp2/3 complex-activating protein rickA-like [Schistocerca cancellata]|uniref:arp2/3 complex-activating protein rickA-like n=1 Tax=Schistocerca cancellata TaxID=274614 RepID=UPI002118063C|nr:arp2/3 complex-activating protein rickA-like [Schistocerca cancellata]